MIVVYLQDKDQARCRYSHHYNGDRGGDAVKQGIEDGKIKPGDLAVTVHVSKAGGLEITKTLKHWAVYKLHGNVEVVPDRVGVLRKDTDYGYYREYMKFGRIKARWYALRKKKV